MYLEIGGAWKNASRSHIVGDDRNSIVDVVVRLKLVLIVYLGWMEDVLLMRDCWLLCCR